MCCAMQRPPSTQEWLTSEIYLNLANAMAKIYKFKFTWRDRTELWVWRQLKLYIRQQYYSVLILSCY